MSKNKDYALLDELFPTASRASSASPTGMASSTSSASSASTKKTFRIFDCLWNDFVDLAAVKKMTQAELINELIKNAIDADRDLIDRYRSLSDDIK